MEVFELLSRTCTENPSNEDVEDLREVLREYPGLWRVYGDLAWRVQRNMIDSTSNVHSIKASLKHGVREMRSGMGYDKAPPLERLLIEQVVVTWLHYYRTERVYQATIDAGGRSLQWERLLSAAQRRYLRAIETLSRVRKMHGHHPIEINIGQQQVNMVK